MDIDDWSPDDTEQQLAEAARRSAVLALEAGVTQQSAGGIVEKLRALAEDALREQKRRSPPHAPMACRAGCDHCCHMRALATAPEVVAIVGYIRTHFSAREIDDLIARVVQTDEATHGMTDEERGQDGRACPLLVGGHCSVYAVRPLECQGYNSTNVEACREARDDYLEWDVPMYFPQFSIFKQVQAGLLQGLIGIDRAGRILDLTTALRIALGTPGAIESWTNGEDVFRSAALPASDPEQRAFKPWVPSDELRHFD